MSRELAALFAQRFIQRRDVKAIQLSTPLGAMSVGDWIPDRKLRTPNTHEPLGFKMSHLLDHIEGNATYGHYMLDAEDKCRVFAFDIDLEKMKPDGSSLGNGYQGSWAQVPNFEKMPFAIYDDEAAQEKWALDQMIVSDGVDPRALWADRRARDARTWYKLQMKELAHKFCKAISEIPLPCAAAYSGSKGVHVYGFTGEMNAGEVREAAMLAMDMVDEFEPFRGENFYRHKNEHPIHGYPSFSVEVFPKQGTLVGKDLGNLMRLPMGRNLKSVDPTFFLDMTVPLGTFAPHPDPVRLLTDGDPFQ